MSKRRGVSWLDFYTYTHTRALFKSLLGAVRVAVYTTAEFYRASGGSIKSVYSLASPIDYNTIYRASIYMYDGNLYLKEKGKKGRRRRGSNWTHVAVFEAHFPRWMWWIGHEKIFSLLLLFVRPFFSFSYVFFFFFLNLFFWPPRTGQVDDLSRARTNGSAPTGSLSLSTVLVVVVVAAGPPGDRIIEQAGLPLDAIASQRVFNKINGTRLQVFCSNQVQGSSDLSFFSFTLLSQKGY